MLAIEISQLKVNISVQTQSIGILSKENSKQLSINICILKEIIHLKEENSKQKYSIESI
jgi:hypothetical protein